MHTTKTRLMDVHFNERFLISNTDLWRRPLTRVTSPLCSTSKQMPPITSASERSLTSDSDARLEKHMRGCCIIHHLLLDTNRAALHSQIQSEAAAEIICWSRGQAEWEGWERVCDEHEKHLFIVPWWWWRGVLYVRACVFHVCTPVFVARVCFMRAAPAAWEMLHFGSRRVLGASG